MQGFVFKGFAMRVGKMGRIRAPSAGEVAVRAGGNGGELELGANGRRTSVHTRNGQSQRVAKKNRGLL